MRRIVEAAVPKRKMNSTQIMMLSFFGAILVGSLLLMIPFATAKGEHTSFLTAIFTATTSICVTGLVVVDTFSHWSWFGQLIILILIQAGGFGIITLYSLAMMALQRKFSLRTRVLIQDYYNLSTIQGLIPFLQRVVKDVLIVEGIGAVLYSFAFIPRFGLGKGLWASIFTSISAFCNAGIDVLGPDSLIPYRANVWINLVTILLIVVGGLGFVVWFDVIDKVKTSAKKKYPVWTFCKRLSEHTKLVLALTAFFLISGWILVAVFEWNNPMTLGGLSVGDKLQTSLFESVTFRTAVFATIPQEHLSSPTALLGCLYMFVGGSPVGTAGGIKTVTIFVVFLNMFTFIRDRSEAVVFNRAVSEKLINKATAIVTFNLILTVTLTILLMQFEHVPAIAAAYEMFSATGTVGLTRGLTQTLHPVGKILVMIGMYAGRIGPISMALAFNTRHSKKNEIQFADGRYIVG